MTAEEQSPRTSWQDETDGLEYELECLFDDMEDPTRVTIFYPRGERTVSEWLTVDIEAACSLDEMA